MKRRVKADVIPVVKRKAKPTKSRAEAPDITEHAARLAHTPKMHKRIRRIFSRASVLIIFSVCGLVSTFLLASGYESMFNKSLPYVRTIEPINLTALSEGFNLSTAAKSDPKRYGIYGKPTTLKLPQQSLRLDIVPPLQDTDGTWLSRTSTMHLLTPSEPRKGSIGLALFYCRSSFRTINTLNVPADGTNIFMDTDTLWRYVYKVTSTSIGPETQEYILADSGDSGRLLISCSDAKTKRNLYIEAKLLSIQGISS